MGLGRELRARARRISGKEPNNECVAVSIGHAAMLESLIRHADGRRLKDRKSRPDEVIS